MDALDRKSWDALPPEIQTKIIGQGATYGAQMLYDLQLVSKPWKEAARRAFSGHLTVNIKNGDAAKLAEISKNLPNISSLEIRSQQKAFDLSPVCRCSALTSLVLEHNLGGLWTGRQRECLVLDVALLPSGLRNLRTDHWTYDISHLSDFRSVRMTSLHFSETKNRHARIHELLRHLPGLKELTQEDPGMLGYWGNYMDYDYYFRFSTQLTKLQLYGGRLTSQYEEPPQLAALEDLKLSRTKMSQTWLRLIYASGVEEVEFYRCYIEGDEQEVAPASAGRLRSLQLNKTPLGFLPQEAAQLQKLTCSFVDEISAADSLAIARLTSLTSLTLSDLQTADLRPLQNLGLQKISLYHCKEAGLTLFAPGSVNPFTELRILHIVENEAELEASCGTLIEAEKQLTETASYIQSLPSLERVSGNSKVFLGMREGFNDWERAWVSAAKQGSHVCSRSICLNAEQTWARGMWLLAEKFLFTPTGSF